MSILRTEDAQKIREHLSERLTGDVTIDFYTQKSLLYVPGRECPYCRETEQMLEEIAALSDRIHLEVNDFYSDTERAAAKGVTHVPAFVLEGAGKGKVRYLGIPAGNEFSGLIEAVIDVSTGTTALTDATREGLKGLTRDVHIQVFVTPT